MDLHSRMFVALCVESTLTSMSWIGSSLPSLWLCNDIQSAINISGPGFTEFGPYIDEFLIEYALYIVIVLQHLF